MARWVIACLLFGVGGCASAIRPFSQEHVEMREYRPLSIPAASSVADRWAYLQRLAAEEAWSLETFDESRGLMIASRSVAGSKEIREHLRILLRPDATEVGVRTQVLDDGEWDTRDVTYGRYEYSRESEIAMKLEPTETGGASPGSTDGDRRARAAAGPLQHR